MLTLKKLKEMKPGTMFAKGETLVEDYWNAEKETRINWVAIRGGIEDWAIYYMSANLCWTDDRIKAMGQKMTNEMSIKNCVPCNDEAYSMYRN